MVPPELAYAQREEEISSSCVTKIFIVAMPCKRLIDAGIDETTNKLVTVMPRLS